MPRIRQVLVSPLFPERGPVRAMLFGEAPGPRGADQSGIPFWGDAAGIPVYRVLEAAEMAEVPPGAFDRWDGAALREAGLAPRLNGVALSNAWPRCPTRDGEHFRAPTDAELRAPDNLDRLRAELDRAAAGTAAEPRVIALGRRAAWVLARLAGAPPFRLEVLPHPSAQGLLQAAPGKGKGLRLEDLRRAWEVRLRDLLQGAFHKI